MTFNDPHLHEQRDSDCNRRSIRLKGYDYTLPGAYFITLVTWQRQNLFGDVEGGEMCLSPTGEIIRQSWLRLQDYFPIQHEAWVIMPNHLHAILYILDLSTGEASGVKGFRNVKYGQADASPRRKPIGTQSDSLGAIIQNFKSITTRKIHQSDGILLDSKCHNSARSNHPDPAWQTHSPIWQRNYYEHIIRTEQDFQNIWNYIATNPLKWQEDQLNPSVINQGASLPPQNLIQE